MEGMISGNHRILAVLGTAVLMAVTAENAGGPAGTSLEENTQNVEAVMAYDNIHWLGHATVLIKGSRTVVVDPFQVNKGEPVDIIPITHDHHDHLSPDDIRKFQGKNTVIVVPKSGAGSVSGNVKTVEPGDVLDVAGVKIQAVPAYTITKPFHPKTNKWVAYVFTLDNVTYYHAGDSDALPEMKSVKADVVFLPVGGTYTMNADEAAGIANAIKPKLAVPIHWGSIIGDRKDAERFKELCKSEVRILEAE